MTVTANVSLFFQDVSIFLGLDGTPTRKVGIEWSGAPEQMGKLKVEGDERS